jgi:hypothetical protein
LLEKYPVDGKRDTFSVHCSNKECKGAGFMRKNAATIAKAYEEADFYEARRNLRDALGMPEERPCKTIEENLKALGF